VPSTRPRHGLGSDGSSGAYLGAARTDEPVPSDISDPDGSVVSGEARGTEPSGEGDDGGAQRQRRRRREARVSAGKSCPNFAVPRVLSRFFVRRLRNDFLQRQAQIGPDFEFGVLVSFSIFIRVHSGKKSFGFSSNFFLKRLRFLFICD
jgi:hypothetical protein